MRALLAQGKSVRMVNHSGKAEVPGGVEVVGGDAFQPEFTRSACQGASVVYQCAQPPYHLWPEKFPPLMASILKGAESAGAIFIFGDNLYMYGEVTGRIHEGLPYAATTHKGRARAMLADSVIQANNSGKVQTAIGRGSDFFGPYVLGSAMGDRTILPALQGKAASITGSLDQPHTFTYIEDFGRALTILGERPEALGQIWHVPNAPAVTQRQFMDLVFQEIGVPPKLSSMGRVMLSIGGLFIPAAKETVEMLYEFEKPFIVDSSKFEKAFGMQATPLPEAIRATVAWYRANMLKAA
jgi:nucleoside-diphosphate-sugar epimerase